MPLALKLILSDEKFEGMILYDGLEDAFIGVAYRFSDPPVAVYQYSKVLEVLGEDMEPEEALEHFEFNVIGGWVGDRTPIFLEMKDEIEM